MSKDRLSLKDQNRRQNYLTPECNDSVPRIQNDASRIFMTRKYWTKDFSQIISETEIAEDYAAPAGFAEIEMDFSHRFRHKDTKGVFGQMDANGFSIDYTRLSQQEALEVQVEQDGPHLELHFELEGEKRFRGSTSRHSDISISAGSHSLLYIPELKGELSFIPLHQKKMEVGIEFSLDYFSRLFNNDLTVLGGFGKDLQEGIPSTLADGLPTTPVMRQALNDILYCPLEGMMKKIYVESKVLELVALVADQARQSVTRDAMEVRKEDVDKLHYAREIILQRMNEPCSLMQLARLTGLNDFKLKKGFRDLFGTTVFGYLLEERMTLAKRRLLEGQMSIADIAAEVGYKNATHFTAAFKRHFGYLPSDIRNVRP